MHRLIIFTVAVAIMRCWRLGETVGVSFSASYRSLAPPNPSKSLNRPAIRNVLDRVKLNGNCKAAIAGDFTQLTPEATPLADVLKKLEATPLNRRKLLGLFAFDSEFSLVGTTPEQREYASNACSAYKQWLATMDPTVEICTLLVFQMVKRPPRGSEATGFDGEVFVNPGDPNNQTALFSFYSKTRQAQECLAEFASASSTQYGSLHTPSIDPEVIETIRARQNYFEDTLLSHKKGSVVPHVLFQLKRHGWNQSPKTYDPKLGRGFEAAKIFFSPNDYKHPAHFLPAVNFLSQATLQNIVHHHNIGLKELLDRFGIEVVYVDIQNKAAKSAIEGEPLTILRHSGKRLSVF